MSPISSDIASVTDTRSVDTLGERQGSTMGHEIISAGGAVGALVGVARAGVL